MNLFGPIPIVNLGRKRYTLVIVDDYTRFIWVFFLAYKDETSSQLIKLFGLVKNEKGEKIKAINNEYGREFDFSKVHKFCRDNGIHHNFLAPRTPQRNGVAERKHITHIEAGRTLLAARLPEYF